MSEADIATLGFEINYGPVTQAEAAIDSFKRASTEAELQANIFTSSINRAGLSMDTAANKSFLLSIQLGEITAAEALAAKGVALNTSAMLENHDALVKLLVSLDPLIAAQQKQAVVIKEGQRLYEANTISLEANARIQRLAQDQFDRTTSKIDGTTAALARLKAAQEAATTQQGIADAFGFGGSGGAKENGAPRNAATSAFNDLPRMTIDPKTGEEINKLTGAINVNRMAMVDLGRVFKDITEGDLLYLAADADEAAARFGILTGSALPLIGLFAALTAAIVGTSLAINQGAEQEAKLNDELQLTGNFANISAGQIDVLARSYATNLHAAVGQVQKDFEQVVGTGQFTSETMQLMTQNAIMFGNYTNTASDKVLLSFEGMDKGVEKFALDFQDHYHNLTVAQLSHIDLLEKEGDKAQAELELQKELYTWLGQQAPQQLGYVDAAWRSITQTISGAIQAVRDFGKQSALKTVHEDQDAISALMIGGGQNQSALGVSQLRAATDKLRMDTMALQSVTIAQGIESDQAQQRQTQTDHLKALNDHWVPLKNNIQNAADELARFNKLAADPAALAAKKLEEGYTGSDQSFIDAERLAIQHKYDAAAFRKTPMSQAQRFGVGTDQVNAEADQELQVASAYMQSSAAGDRLVGSIKAIKDAKDKKLEGDQAEARIAADENLQINKTIENNAQRMAQAREEQQIRSGILAQEQAGVINSAQYNQEVSETIALLPYWTSLQAAQTDAQKAAAQAVFDAQKKVLDQGYSDKTTQSLIANNELSKDQIALLNLKIQLQYTDQQQATVSLAMFQKRLELERAHPGSSNTLEGAIAIANAGTQASLNNQISNKFGGENIAAQEEAITNAQRQLNSAVQAGAVNLAQYNVALTHIQQMQLELTAGKSGHWTDAMIAGLHKLVDTGKTASQQLQDNFEQLFSSLENGFANSIGKAIVGAEDLKQGLHDAAQQGIGDFIAGLVKMGEQWVINKLLASTLGASSTLEGTAQATALALAWDPVATAVSIATFGAADAAASAAMTATYALGMVLGAPKAAGGWVHGPGGPTSDSVLTPTSDGEFVTRASVAQDPINARILEQMNAGKKFSAGYAAGGFIGNAQQIGSTSNSSSHQNIVHLDFSNANFAGANKDEIIDAIDERLNDVWAPAIIQTSVTGSLTAQGKINRRQRLNSGSANRNGK